MKVLRVHVSRPVGKTAFTCSYNSWSFHFLFLLCYQYLFMELIIICTFKCLEIVNKYMSMYITYIRRILNALPLSISPLEIKYIPRHFAFDLHPVCLSIHLTIP